MSIICCGLCFFIISCDLHQGRLTFSSLPYRKVQMTLSHSFFTFCRPNFFFAFSFYSAPRAHMGVRINFSRGGNVNSLLNFLRLLTMQCRCTFAKHFSFTTRLHHKENALCYNGHKTALWQPSQVYSDHLQNRLSANFESRILIFTEVLPWSLTNP